MELFPAARARLQALDEPKHQNINLELIHFRGKINFRFLLHRSDFDTTGTGMMMPRALALALLMATAADAFYGVGVLPCSLKRGMPKLHLSSANLGRSAPLLRAAATSTRRASKGGLCMQWKEEQPLPYQAQWEAFQNYNTGRWKGRLASPRPRLAL